MKNYVFVLVFKAKILDRVKNNYVHRLQWILLEQTSLYTVVYRTFLYNPTNPKEPKKTQCAAKCSVLQFIARDATEVVTLGPGHVRKTPSGHSIE